MGCVGVCCLEFCVGWLFCVFGIVCYLWLGSYLGVGLMVWIRVLAFVFCVGGLGLLVAWWFGFKFHKFR